MKLAPLTERWLEESVTGFQINGVLRTLGLHAGGPPGESRTESIIRQCSPLLHPEEEDWLLAWPYLDGLSCLWLAGGHAETVDAAAVGSACGVPVFVCPDGVFAGEAGGLAILVRNQCRGMVCDLGQSFLKVSWAGRRWLFPRDHRLLPLSKGDESITAKGLQRRALRSFVADGMASAVRESDAGMPEGVVFALPTALDQWGQPAGSTYAGMKFDTQLVSDALDLAGLTGARLWLLNDAELAAYSALQDERVLENPNALVLTMGTAVGSAVADPVQWTARVLQTMAVGG